MKNQDSSSSPEINKSKEFTSSAEAANAAKNDMIAAMDKNVNFGVDKEKLKSSTPGEAISRYELDMNVLLSADSTFSFEKFLINSGSSIVPLVNSNEIIAVISLRNDNKLFSIAGLGDNSISSELNMIYSENTAKGSIAIMEVPNLNATIYEMRGANGAMYHTAYGGHNIKEGLSASELIKILKMDAEVFQRKFGDKLKKQKLVH